MSFWSSRMSQILNRYAEQIRDNAWHLIFDVFLYNLVIYIDKGSTNIYKFWPKEIHGKLDHIL